MNEAARRLWAKCSRDPILFCRTFLPKKPHPGQATWLRNSVQPINVLVPGNRWGKSTIIAEKHIWKCVFKVGIKVRSRAEWKAAEYETISVAMSADQAAIVFREAKKLLKDSPLRVLVKAMRSTPFPHIIFANGSVMHCRSAHDDGKYIDGHAYRYLSIDEAGWIPMLKTLMTNVIVMRLAGGGEIDLIGTPKGYNDLYFYYERGQRGVRGYYSQRGSIYDNPHLPPEDIKMRDQLLMSADPKIRAQVLNGEFVDFSGLAFTRDQRDNAFDPAMRDREDYIVGHKYVVAFDLGRTTDFTVGTVLDVTTRPWRLVYYIRLNKVAWEEIYATIDRVTQEYHARFARIDATGPQGDVIEEEMTKRKIRVDPFKTSTRASKLDIINGLQSALDEGRKVIGETETTDDNGVTFRHPVLEGPGEGDWGLLRLPCISQLMDEMGIYSIDDKNIPFTDSVMSLALCVDLAREMEGISPPVVGGMYWAPDKEKDPTPVTERVEPYRLPVGVDGMILGGSNHG
ncbi:MAG TPA: hypothetical protein VF960_06035 [Chloroflexota bacterium]